MTAADTDSGALISERVAGGILPKVLTTFDMVAIFVAIVLFITVVYSYSFARLIFVSGLDQRLPKAMSHVNEARVPYTAVCVQTVIAALFTLLAFVVIPSVTSGSSVYAETKIYGVLLPAVAVIWWIGGITLASLAVAALLYLVGRMSGNGAEPLPAGAGRHRAPGDG
jgi:hypothetical protein